ncbi:hypothetical protein V493_02747 [Pseudogymnoascus sp. VKM F-4281 (FW-2241)]|nr:hypothetical protein V493_02747 [Pseudogymnoascus sp. VKM F-4281 (FW-2241)]
MLPSPQTTEAVQPGNFVEELVLMLVAEQSDVERLEFFFSNFGDALVLHFCKEPRAAGENRDVLTAELRGDLPGCVTPTGPPPAIGISFA